MQLSHSVHGRLVMQIEESIIDATHYPSTIILVNLKCCLQLQGTRRHRGFRRHCHFSGSAPQHFAEAYHRAREASLFQREVRAVCGRR